MIGEHKENVDYNSALKIFIETGNIDDKKTKNVSNILILTIRARKLFILIYFTQTFLGTTRYLIQTSVLFG